MNQLITGFTRTELEEMDYLILAILQNSSYQFTAIAVKLLPPC